MIKERFLSTAMKTTGLFLLILLFLTACSNRRDRLEENFAAPPASFRPRTWMHAMSGNMTEAGLTKDLEAIAEAGIGGVLLFNVSQGIPNGPVIYNSDRHHKLIQHAASECERLGLSFGVHNCDGWSSSGGPWIKPEQSMKMVAWTETMVEGRNGVKVKLKQPTTREGFYRDIAVLAYPSLQTEIEDFENLPVISSSDKGFDPSVAADYRIDRESLVRAGSQNDTWIQFDYRRPKTIRALHMVFNDRDGQAVLQYSQDGKKFHTVERELYKVRTGKGEWNIVDHFEPVTARVFRLNLNQAMTIKEARLMSNYTIQNFPGRSSLARTDDADMLPIGDPEESMVIPLNAIIDLSDQMDREGNLTADLPSGPWTIIRFGYTSTGAFNHPASDEGRGLECDKFSKEAFEVHYNSFVSRVIREAGINAPTALQYIEIDSYEMGGQNWTDGFMNIFKEKKGYDLTPFLPLFAGKFMGDRDVSEAVLWDLREVYGQLMAENYYGHFTALCHRDGVETYIEPYGNGPFNDLDAGGKADMVMGEFWMNRPMTQVASAISSGHIYGKEVISAESFTSTFEINWMGHPAMAKLSGDRAWAAGINEFMFHRFVHQANTHVKPGLTMNRWGFHFDRTQTWWRNAGPSWFRYMARGAFLLRQGVPVSDLLIFVGDGSPSSTFGRDDFNPKIPAGTEFDCVNRDVLLNRITISDGQLILPEGTSYRALVLKNCEKLSFESMERLHEIAMAGVPVVGLTRIRPAGYLVREGMDLRFEQMVQEMENRPNCYSGFNWGTVIRELGLRPDFRIEGREDIDFIHRKMGNDDFYFFYNPDSVAGTFEVTFRVTEKIPELWDPMSGQITRLGHFTHDNGQCKTWIRLEANESVFVGFRESAKRIDAVREVMNEGFEGKIELDNKHELMLKTRWEGSVDLLLNSGETVRLAIEDIPPPFRIQGPWQVAFQEQYGYGAIHKFEELTDWSKHEEEGIRYYAGTAVYSTSFTLPHYSREEGLEYFLDLGQVNIIAEVTLNGERLDTLWIHPYQVNLTHALRAGENHLEISVTNQWSNRLIGDERFPDQGTKIRLEGNFPKGKMPAWYINNEPLPAGPRTTFCTGGFYSASDPLLPSGLVGPVTLFTQRTAKYQ